MSNPISIPLPHNPQREAQAIREERRLYNEAIAAHDARHVGECWLSDIHVSTSDGRPLVGREAVQRTFEKFFADPSFITFVRTPTEIKIGEDGRTAAEAGEWLGQWHGADGLNTRRGAYLASWCKQGKQWRLQAELFVPLG